jgi:hypothetical protein
LSVDSVAFVGPVLKELQDPEGLDLDLYVPPIQEQQTTCFAPEDFKEDTSQGTLTCPAGQSTARRDRNRYDTGWKYYFPAEVCAGCALRERCLQKPSANTRRAVIKNEYEPQYRAMRTKAQTAEYAAVRREHPKIERKLSELVRRHGVRRARYRGGGKVPIGGLLAGTVVNIKRMVHLLCAPKLAMEGT